MSQPVLSSGTWRIVAANEEIMDILNFPFYFRAWVFHYPA